MRLARRIHAAIASSANTPVWRRSGCRSEAIRHPHPLLELPFELPGDTHCPAELHTLGVAQSSTDAHTVLHLPPLSQRYGAQSVEPPITLVSVWSPSQVALATHLPESHR